MSGVSRLIANPPHPHRLRKHTRSQGPFLRRNYPTSQVLRPCPTPARPIAQRRCWNCDFQPNGSPPITRFTLPACCAHYPGEPNRGARRLLACSCCLPQIHGGSAFALDLSRPARALIAVTARWIAQPPSSGFCHEAPAQPVAQLNRSSATGPIDNYPYGAYLHW